MVWLLDGEKSLRISVTVLTEYRRVTDRWTDRQTDRIDDNIYSRFFLFFNTDLLFQD